MFGLDKYHYRASKTYMVYAFQSQGLKGVIEKIAKFTSLGTNVYNFGFGDLDPVTGNISDTITSNNGDIDTIMGTLGSIVYDFTNIFMEALIIIEGTDSARTRLYQMNINKHWDRIHPVFEVFGLRKDNWEPFKKGINYQAIAGRRKGAFLLPI
ncbi:MAG: hypothetical protein WCH78_10865 [Bacteroidota bacterium]|jgi:hypothetical protein